MVSSSAEAPKFTVRWFHAVDVPKHDSSPFKVVSTTTAQKPPSSWKPFSERDSADLEATWQRLQKSSEKRKSEGDPSTAEIQVDSKVPVNEDHLFEADVEKMETYPVYWHGPTYDIRRGTWFYAAFGGNYLPCDENLSRQIEDGYRKFKPWKTAPQQSTGVPKSISSSTPNTSETTEHGSKNFHDQKEQRWALFGPYMNQYVVYQGPHMAFQFSDLLSSKIGRAVMNIGGTRLIRGWDEVERLKKTKAQVAKEKEKEKETSKDRSGELGKDVTTDVQTDPLQKAGDKVSIASLIAEMTPATSSTNTITPDQAEKLQEKTEAEDYSESDDSDRTIHHLVLVIHGIGQKLGERVEAVNFVHDCNMLRRTIKESSRQYATAKDQLRSSRKAGSTSMPDDGGVQILPVQWRQKIQFGMSRKMKAAGTNDAEANEQFETETTLEDITLEGVPSIRQLVSDVVLDVLLYMTPRYRQEMIKHVTDELNRIYQLFKERNPKFNGKVSILGHSLGSLLAFDILCNQPFKRNGIPVVGLQPPTSGGIKRPAEVDLTDLLHGAMSAEDRRVKGLMERTNMRYDQLEFEVDKLFVVGSPVGLFLLLKGDKLQARTPDMAPPPSEGDQVEGVSYPAVNAVYNIFHPHDPVAYRIEPIIKREFAETKPVPIPYTKGGLKGTIVGIQDLGNDIADRGRSMLEAAKLGIVSTTAVVTSGLTSSVGKVVTMVSSINAFKPTGRTSPNAFTEGKLDDEGHEGLPTVVVGDDGKFGTKADTRARETRTENHESEVEMQEILPSGGEVSGVERLNPRGRIDYVLQEGMLENPYISALGVHMNYWSDPDCALFVLRELYGETIGDSNRLSGSWSNVAGGRRGSGGEGGGEKPHGTGEGDSHAGREPHGGASGSGNTKSNKSGGFSAFVRGTTKRVTQMAPDDLSVFGKGKPWDMSIPVVFPNTQGSPTLDAYSLL
ncbi:hypothetical protein SpCBS45565_g07522 [Spizellomyces sp. 'palustris']|nr:hypothetical protein SpCBS45565_g07522 [Spizellomyces sp. 'palustris']